MDFFENATRTESLYSTFPSYYFKSCTYNISHPFSQEYEIILSRNVATNPLYSTNRLPFPSQNTLKSPKKRLAQNQICNLEEAERSFGAAPKGKQNSQLRWTGEEMEQVTNWRGAGCSSKPFTFDSLSNLPPTFPPPRRGRWLDGAEAGGPEPGDKSYLTPFEFRGAYIKCTGDNWLSGRAARDQAFLFERTPPRKMRSGLLTPWDIYAPRCHRKSVYIRIRAGFGRFITRFRAGETKGFFIPPLSFRKLEFSSWEVFWICTGVFLIILVSVAKLKIVWIYI